MKVLVTGAAGMLGRHCVAELLRDGFQVIATDRHETVPLGCPLLVADLLDTTAVAALCKGVEAVVHLGNHAGPKYAEQARTFNENVAMDMNVFQAALDHAVRKVVFASSIQVIASEPPKGQSAPIPPSVAYLPLDGDCPPQPTNTYALSKWVGEVMLRDYVAPRGVECVALRFPMLRTTEDAAELLARASQPWPSDASPSPYRRAQAFTLLSLADGARLIQAVLRHALPGFRTYLPAASTVPPEQIAEIVQRYYAGVPLRRPLGQITSLIDLYRIEKETGWRPFDCHAASEANNQPRSQPCPTSVTSASS